MNAMKFLIISHVFPPCTTGAGTVMYNMCKYLPKDIYAVITTRKDFYITRGIYDINYELDCNTARLPVRTRSTVDLFIFLVLTVFKGLEMNKRTGIRCILAIHPYFHGVMGGYVLHVLTKKPIVVYMHDLFSEQKQGGLLFRVWESIERKIFAGASLVLVMNEKYRQHYAARGIRNTAIFPPTIDLAYNGRISRKIDSSDSLLKIVYTGSVYGPQEKAVLAFLKAAKNLSGVQVSFATPTGKGYIKDHIRDIIKDVSVGFLSKAECKELQESADILFLPLSYNSLYSKEADVAFPCKLLEYLAAGKPILAVVPKGSFVESFVKKYEVGIAVNELSVEKIVDAINELKNETKRARFAQNALRTINLFDNKVWAEKLILLLNDVASNRKKSARNRLNY